MPLAPAARGAEITAIVSTVDDKTAQALVDTFMPLFLRTEDAVMDARLVTVADEHDQAGMEAAREARLKIREIRITAERSRKAFKENALRIGQAIDKIAKLIFDKIEPVEAALLDKEKYAERIREAAKAKLVKERSELLMNYGAAPDVYPLGELDEVAFGNLLEGWKVTHERKIEAERKAQAERVAAEEARKAENDRLREEAERRRVAEEKAQMAKDAALAEARRAREALEAAEAKERERVAAEQRKAAAEKAAAEKAARAAARAPDRAKLMGYALAVRSLQMPDLSTEAGKAAGAEIKDATERLAKFIETKARGLD